MSVMADITCPYQRALCLCCTELFLEKNLVQKQLLGVKNLV